MNSEVVIQIDEFNSLYADMTESKISAAEFRAAAVERLGYDQAEVTIMRGDNHDKATSPTPT